MIVDAKWCPKCCQLRRVGAFGPDTYKADGLSSRCRSCDNAKAKAYYQANREARLAYQNGYNRKKRSAR